MGLKLLKGLELIDRNRWIDLLNKNRYASPFQSPEYADLMNATEGYSAEVYAVENDGVLKALCLVTIQKESGLKAYFSKRGIVYGGPLIVENSSEALFTLIQYIEKELKGQSIYLEVRNFHNYSSFVEVFNEEGWDYTPYLNIQIELNGVEISSLLANMKSNRRREIRYSEEEGATAKILNSENDLEELYDILYDLYVNVVKLPIPRYEYFLNLYNSSIGKIIGVFHQNRLIGGAVCLFYQNTSIYTQYYCGLRDYHKRIYPTHLAIKKAMEFGIENDLKSIDLMGAGKPGEEYGVRKYKKQFGGEVVEHGRFFKVLNPVLFKTGKMGLEIMQKFNIRI